MKIAIDENIPIAIVKMLASLAKDDDSKKVTVVSAKKYRPTEEKGDGNWVRRFARAGGKIVITGDARIRGNLHEQAAFFRAGMITFFFDSGWHKLTLNEKAAMLMRWWPEILTTAKSSQPGDSWETPSQWTIKEMRFVRPPPEAIAKYPHSKSVGKIPPRKRRKRG